MFFCQPCVVVIYFKNLFVVIYRNVTVVTFEYLNVRKLLYFLRTHLAAH